MNPASMLIVSPQNWWSLGKSVSGTVDSDYQADWLVDGRVGYPVRAAGGSPASGLDLTISGAPGDINIAIVGHHNLVVPITFSGGITATVTPASTRPPNGIPLNPFALLETTAEGVTSVEMQVSGNDVDEIIGEVVLGTYTEVTPTKIDDAAFGSNDYATQPQGDFLSVPPYNKRLRGRTHSGSQYYTSAELQTLTDAYDAQSMNEGGYPIVLITDPDSNDAWFCRMTKLDAKPYPKSRDLWLVSYEFVEMPRKRWP